MPFADVNGNCLLCHGPLAPGWPDCMRRPQSDRERAERDRERELAANARWAERERESARRRLR